MCTGNNFLKFQFPDKILLQLFWSLAASTIQGSTEKLLQKFITPHVTSAAPSLQSYPRRCIATLRMVPWLVGLKTVFSGIRDPGASHTTTSPGELDICPGPLSQGCILLEVPLTPALARQCWWRRTVQWRRGLNSNVEDSNVQNKYIKDWCHFFISDRDACAISDPFNKEVVITGGHTSSSVSVYSEAGWQRELAQLTQKRDKHACSIFIHAGEGV